MEQADRKTDYFFKENEDALSQISADGLQDMMNLTTIILEGEKYDSALKESAYGILCAGD